MRSRASRCQTWRSGSRAKQTRRRSAKRSRRGSTTTSASADSPWLLTGRLAPWGVVGAYLLHGFAQLFMTFNVGHDANHAAYSRHKRVNQVLSCVFDLCGGSSYMWRLMHNASHHSFINIHDADTTLISGNIFRFSPLDPRRPFHRWQHLYAPFLYSLSKLDWVFVNRVDFPAEPLQRVGHVCRSRRGRPHRERLHSARLRHHARLRRRRPGRHLVPRRPESAHHPPHVPRHLSRPLRTVEPDPESTAEEHGLRYWESPTISGAFLDHLRWLRVLGARTVTRSNPSLLHSSLPTP